MPSPTVNNYSHMSASRDNSSSDSKDWKTMLADEQDFYSNDGKSSTEIEKLRKSASASSSVIPTHQPLFKNSSFSFLSRKRKAPEADSNTNPFVINKSLDTTSEENNSKPKRRCIFNVLYPSFRKKEKAKYKKLLDMHASYRPLDKRITSLPTIKPPKIENKPKQETSFLNKLKKMKDSIKAPLNKAPITSTPAYPSIPQPIIFLDADTSLIKNQSITEAKNPPPIDPFIISDLPESYESYVKAKKSERKSIFYKKAWLDELRKGLSEAEEVVKMRIEKLEENLQKCSKDRINNELDLMRKMRHITPRKSELHTTSPYFKYIFVEEEEEDEEEIEEKQEVDIKLSEDQLETIEEALMLQGRNEDEILDGGNLMRKDIQTLAGLNWLNDEVINEYFTLIQKRSSNCSTYPKAYCFNTFFYSRLKEKGFLGVKRWTKKVDLFSYDLILIPVHLGMHWTLACIDIKNKRIMYYDSMNGNGKEILNLISSYLKDESRDKRKRDVSEEMEEEWIIMQKKDVPQQQNGSDCGMFTCKYAESLSRGEDSFRSVTQSRMPLFRRLMIWELLEKKLFSFSSA